MKPSHAPRISRALVVSALVAVATAVPAAAQVCNPFGDAPRPMTLDTSVLTCTGGAMMPSWADANGTPRTACLYEPASASPSSPLPLVVYVHPSLFTADTIAAVTNILSFQNTADLSGDPARPGFIVVAPEGRSTQHFYPTPDDTGTGWDNWYRQLDKRGRDVMVDGSTYAQNVDAATIDHFIDAEVATGKVDTRRIYVTGWSNGAAMGMLYALNRTRIAAAAVYTAPDAFEAFNDSCPQMPVSRRPRSDAEIRVSNKRVPILHVHNACDIAGICPNGERLLGDLLAIHARVTDIIIDDSQQKVTMCNAQCGTNPDGDLSPADNPLGFTEGSANHVRWPTEWTASMLAFFRAHRGHR
ncbi:MAG TPA: PHB depolymerase family esterase [Candidatus Binatia bacterium]